MWKLFQQVIDAVQPGAFLVDGRFATSCQISVKVHATMRLTRLLQSNDY
jgi:hypothetical protein